MTHVPSQSVNISKVSYCLSSKLVTSWFATFLLCAFWLSPTSLHATPVNTKIQAPGFESWTQWISDDLDYLDCAQRSQKYQCLWMSKLLIKLKQDQQAELSYGVFVGKKTLVPLLKDSRVAIHSVNLVSGEKPRALTVVWKDHTAWVELEAGKHQINAQITWNSSIDTLKIPEGIAQVKLVDQKGERAWVDRDQSGAIWLNERSTKASAIQGPQQESNIQIFRVWYDEVPLKLETHIQLNVSGSAREQIISGLQIKGSINTQLDSALEVDWVKEGLRVYLKPGQSSIKLISVFPESPKTLTVPTVKGAKLANQEVWVWHRRELLRRVQLTGLDEVDPEFTALPQSLRGGTHTWLAVPGKVLNIKELQRGVQKRPSNELRLTRKLWLDLDGIGYTAQDHMSGSLKASSRLNVLSQSTLGRANLEEHHKAIPLLITLDEEKQQEGLEIRSEKLSLFADFRYPKLSHSIPALDWSVPVSSLQMTLNLPPGWRLFSIGNGAYSADEWLSSWQMSDIFLSALVTIAFFKLFGFIWAFLAILALVLFHTDASIYYELLSISIAFFLLKASLSHHIFSRLISFGFCVVFLSFMASVFSLGQDDFRTALHPQLDEHGTSSSYYNNYRSVSISRKVFEDAKVSKKSKWRKAKSQYGELDLNQQLQQLDQNAVVQTGPGIPRWKWRTHDIFFEAPIEPGRQLKLSLIAPMWTRISVLVRSLALLSLFVMLLVQLKSLPWENLGRTKDELKQKLPALFLCLVLGLIISPIPSAFADEPVPTAHPNFDLQVQQSQTSNLPSVIVPQNQVQQVNLGQIQLNNQSFQENSESNTSANLSSVTSVINQPSPQLVQEWRARLKQEKSCQGECLYVGHMDLSIHQQQVLLTTMIHAEKDSIFTLPGTLDTIHWEETNIGESQLPMRLESSQENHEIKHTTVRIPKGVHTVTALGQIPEQEQMSINLTDPPKTLALSLKSWLELTNRNGKVSSLINLKRVDQKVTQDDKSKTKNKDSQELGKLSMDYSWFTVKKSLNLGPVWQIVTQIERQSSTYAEDLVLPLIQGERVLSSEHEISEQGVKVSFAAGQTQAGYFSELSPVALLKLTAAKARWAETWTLNCGVLWRCTASGLNPISLGGGSQASLTWRPWPGESVDISIKRPKGIKGSEVTVNQLTYEFKPSTHLAQGTITLSLNASKGGSKEIILPKEAKKINLMINGKQQFDPAKQNKVRLPIKPGENSFKITWQQDWKRSFSEKVPSITTDLQGVNVNQHFVVGQRWLLWANGPAWGPAILMWGKLFFAFILAIILAWRPWAPLNTWQWFLLLAGLAQHHPTVWVISILWFAAFAVRQLYWHKVKSIMLFNLGQLALVGGTVIFLIFFTYIVQSNLLSSVDMQVSGNHSNTGQLKWYVDHLDFSQGSDHIMVYSAPMWLWRVLMLIWALWFASQLFAWLKWAWRSLNHKGSWRSSDDAHLSQTKNQ